MEKINYIKRNCGVGKIAAMPQIKDIVSFTKNPIRTICVHHYYRFLKEYCNYDKVYLVSNIPTLDESHWKCDNILKDIPIIYGISKKNLLNEYNIDDMYLIPSTNNYYGGCVFLHAPFNYNRITEWWLENKDNPDKHIFYIQDDPLFPNVNFAKTTCKRLFDLKNLKCFGNKTNSQEMIDKEIELLKENRENVEKMFDSLTVAFCGIDYEKYWYSIKEANRPSTQAWDNFNCYLWNGVNDNLEAKLVDYDWDNKKYDCEYHGVTKSGKRTKVTENYYTALKNKFMHVVGRSEFFHNLKEGVNFDKYDVTPYYELLQLVAKNAKSAFITHEDNILGNQISPRYFDCMLSDIVAFVDLRYDPEKKLTDNEELKEFMYVSTPEEFSKKVDKIANDKQYFRHIVKLQRKSIFDNFGEFIEENNKEKYFKFI
jgi:hypothetical protein